MYHLWGSGGAPFSSLPNGNVRDRAGTEVRLLSAVRGILHELDTHPRWACDEPAWAHECLSKIRIEDSSERVIADMVAVSEIHKGSKRAHLSAIREQTGVAFAQMVFFDDHRDNCEAVAGLGVTCYHVPRDGVTREAWQTMLSTFPAPGRIFKC
jgi:magnesium-dependent phosphatase-1